MADRSVIVRIGANVSGLQNGLRTAKGAVEDFGKSATARFEQNRESLDQIANTSLKVGAGLTAVAGFAVKSAMDWEQAWTGVLKTVDGTGPQLNRLEGDLRSLAKETGFAHDEVAAVAEAAGQLGISTEGVAKFTDTMLAMGVSTNMSAEEAATTLARLRNIMGTSEAEIANMGSTIVGLGNNFATTEGEIAAMSLRLGGAGRQIGLTTAQVMGIATAMSSVGIEAEAGGTAMSLTMKRIEKEVDSGGSKLQMFADVAGMSADDFATKWKDDAAGALSDFVAGLSTVDQRGQSANAVLRELGVTGIREGDALLRLSGNAVGLADALEMASKEWARNTALMEEAEKFYGTTGQKAKQAWASVKDAAIDAGESLLPVVSKVLDGVSGLAGAFGALPDPVKSSVTAVAGVAGVSLLAVGGLIKLTNAVLAVNTAFTKLETSGGKGGGFIAGLGRNATRAAIPLAAAVGTYAALEKAADRGSEGVSKLSKELAEFGKTGKVGTDLTDVFGDDFEGKSRRFARDIRDLGEAIQEFDRTGDDGWATRQARKIGGIFGSGFVGSLTATEGVYKSVKAIKDMDAAYAQLSRNKPDEAIKSFERLRDTALSQGASIDQVARAFPTMTELLRSSSEAMGGTSDAAEVLSGNLTELAPAAQESAEDMAKMREEAAAIGESFFDMSDALEGSLAGLSKTFEKQADELANFRENAATALAKGADETLVDYLVSQGPAGVGMLAQLAGASQEATASINEGWARSREEIAKFVEFKTGTDWEIVAEFSTPGADGAIDKAIEVANQYNLTPDQVITVLEALDYATEDIEAVAARMRAIDGMRAFLQVFADTSAARAAIAAIPGVGAPLSIMLNVASRVAAANAIGGFYEGGVRAFASGGIDERGRSVPRTPQIRSGAQGAVVWGEAETGWEAYVSGKPGMEGRNRAVLGEAAARLGGDVTWYASGGFVEAVSPSELTRMRIRVRDLERDLRATGDDRLRGLDRTLAQQELRDAKAELARATSANRRIPKGFTADWWNDARSVAHDFRDRRMDEAALASPASFERHMNQMLAESAQFTQALAELKKKGASPWILNQLIGFGPSRASIRTARALAKDTTQLRRLNATAGQLDQVTGAYGRLTTDPRFLQAGAMTPAWSANQQRAVRQGANITIQVSDNAQARREMARLVRHELEQVERESGG